MNIKILSNLLLSGMYLYISEVHIIITYMFL